MYKPNEIDFPDVLATNVTRHIVIAEVTVDAALNGDRDLFIEAIAMGGYMQDRKQIEKMVEELIDAQKSYLPQF